MEQLTNGTSAVTASCTDGVCWRLRKTGGTDQMSSYELWSGDAADAGAPKVMVNVISDLLDGMHVGVIAESDATGPLSSLGSVWRDGRVLKRSQSSAFVALDDQFGGIPSEGIVGTGAAFRFMGFDGNVPEDMVFRSLMEGDNGAAIELSCRDFADGVLCIRFDGEKIDETVALGEISEAIGNCGRSLQVDL